MGSSKENSSYSKLLNEELEDSTISGDVEECCIENMEILEDNSFFIGILKASPICWSHQDDLACYINGKGQVCINGRKEDGKYAHLYQLLEMNEMVHYLLFNSTDSLLACCCQNGFMVWNMQTRKCLFNDVRTVPSYCCCWIEEFGLLVVGYEDGVIGLYDYSNKYSTVMLQQFTRSAITSMLFNSTKKVLITSGHDSTISVYSVKRESLSIIHSLQEHQGDVTSLALSPDHHFLVSGGRDHSLRLWNLDTYRIIRCIEDADSPFDRYRGEILCIQFISNNEILLVSGDGTVLCVQINIENPQMSFDMSIDDVLNGVYDDIDTDPLRSTKDRILCECVVNNHEPISHASISSSLSHIIISTVDCEMQLYTLSFLASSFDIKKNTIYSSPSQAITAITTNEDCSIVCASKDGSLYYYDYADHNLLYTCAYHSSLSSLVSLPTCSLLAGKEYSVSVVSNATHQTMYSLIGHVGSITCLAVCKSHSMVFSGSEDGLLLCHILPTTERTSINPVPLSPYMKYQDHNGYITAMDTSPSLNGVFCVATGGNDYAINVYRIHTDDVIRQWHHEGAHQSSITCILFGVGMGVGLLYSASMDHSICVWSVKNGDYMCCLSYHKAKVTALCQSTNGRYLFSASADGSIIMYDISNKFHVTRVMESKGELSALAYINGNLVSGSTAGYIQGWNTPDMSLNCSSASSICTALF